MAKRSYQKVDAYWKPDLKNEGSHISMTFSGQNSKGTKATTTVQIQKGAMPGMIRDIVSIFSADATAFVRALELVKEAAK